MPKESREFPRESTEDDNHTADFNGHKLDVYKLVALAQELELPIEEMDISELESFRYDNHWYDANKNWIVTDELIKEAEKYKDWDKVIQEHPEWEKEVRKIQNADYENYPIVLMGDIVIDGIHRLTKAWLGGARTIKVRRFKQLSEEKLKELESNVESK